MPLFIVALFLFTLNFTAIASDLSADETNEDGSIIEPVRDPILVSHLSSRHLMNFSSGIPTHRANREKHEREDKLTNDFAKIKRFFVDKFGPCALLMEPILSPDASMIVTKNKNMAIAWQNHDDDIKKLFTLDRHTKDITTILLSQRTRQIITISKDKTVKFWSMADGELEYELPEHSSEIVSFAFNDDLTECALTTKQGSAYIWLLPQFHD